MIEALGLFKDFTPGAYGIWTGILMFAAWMFREWREVRKLSTEDRQARREGYAKQVESLQVENRALRAELRDVRAEAENRVQAIQQQYDDHRILCHAENDQLRKMVIGLEEKVSGLERNRADDAIQLARLKKGPGV